jgi:hypothetical protein
MVTSKNRAAVAVRVEGSEGFTPINLDFIPLYEHQCSEQSDGDTDRAEAQPEAIIKVKMLCGTAPKATRTPISAVLWRTMVELTP